jgi:hypothetical protein
MLEQVMAFRSSSVAGIAYGKRQSAEQQLGRLGPPLDDIRRIVAEVGHRVVALAPAELGIFSLPAAWASRKSRASRANSRISLGTGSPPVLLSLPIFV